jgi:hypothetical protein
MGSWANDHQLIALMRAYVVASNRVENLAGRSDVPVEVVETCRAAQRQAAADYEEALLARGWHIPGLLSSTSTSPRGALTF